MMNEPSGHEPTLLKATDLPKSDIGVFEWNCDHNSELLTVSNSGLTIAWGPRKPEYKGESYPPAWVPASTLSHLHSGKFRWDFVIEEMAQAQIGVGFMLLWDTGPDWGFYGYLGASPSALAYDPSSGDVVCNTESIQGGLPKFADGRTGTVTVLLNLPRRAEGLARFIIQGIDTQDIRLPRAAVILPAACFLKESQRITLANLERY